MADLTLTATSVAPGANAVTIQGVAGETITAGQPVYLAAATGKWMKADCDSATAEARVATGIALGGAAINQALVIQTAGDITIGATLTLGTAYYLSKTAGGICPFADLTTGAYPQLIGFAKSTSVLALSFLRSPTAV